MHLYSLFPVVIRLDIIHYVLSIMLGTKEVFKDFFPSQSYICLEYNLSNSCWWGNNQLATVKGILSTNYSLIDSIY